MAGIGWDTLLSGVGSGVASYAASKQNSKDQAAARELDRQKMLQQQKQFDADLAEQQRTSNNNYQQKAFDTNSSNALQSTDRAQGLNRELEVLPARDKAMALMTQMMGQAPAQVAPRSLAGGGTDALRGGASPQMPYNLNAQQAAAAAYKAGDGGMTGDVQKQLLEKMLHMPEAPAMQGVPTAAPTAPAADAPSQLSMIQADMAKKGIPANVILTTLAALQKNPAALAATFATIGGK